MAQLPWSSGSRVLGLGFTGLGFRVPALSLLAFERRKDNRVED